MSDRKLTALTAVSDLADPDLLYVVDGVGSSPTSKNITGANLKAAMVTATGAVYAPSDDVKNRDGDLIGVCGGLHTYEVTSSTPTPYDYWGGYFWGTKSDSSAWRSVDGKAWEEVVGPTNGPAASFRRLILCSDGEVIWVHPDAIYRSSGWGTNPDTATWTSVATPSTGAYFLQWGVDGDGTKFIAAEYATTSGDGWEASRRVRVSTDSGATWTVAYDSASEYASDNPDTHHHAACYDPWRDRFWFSEGHTTNGGCYYSDDDGSTWTRAPFGWVDAANTAEVNGPTVMVPTDDGIVCGSDDIHNGVYGIYATDVAADQTVEWLWQWDDSGRGVDPDGTAPASQLIGFAMQGYRDPDTGLVYIGFRSNFTDVRPIVAAGTARVAGRVYRREGVGDGTQERFGSVVAGTGGIVAGHFVSDGGNEGFRALTRTATADLPTLPTSQWVDASSVVSVLGTGVPTLDTTGQADSSRRRPVRLFPSDALARSAVEVLVPFAAFDVQLHWTVAAGSGDVVWRVAVADADDPDVFGSFTDVTVTAPSALVRARTTVVDGLTSPSSDGLVRVWVERRYTDGGDTLADDALLLGVLIVEDA